MVYHMQLNTFSDYALRVLIYAAARPNDRCTCEEVATAFGVSRHHLVKVVNGLEHLGYLETVRGRAGGFHLARSPERIRVGEVVRQTEGTLAVVECFDPRKNTCPLTRACGLKGALAEAIGAFLSVLDGYSLADLVRKPEWMAGVIALTPASGTSGRPKRPVV